MQEKRDQLECPLLGLLLKPHGAYLQVLHPTLIAIVRRAMIPAEQQSADLAMSHAMVLQVSVARRTCDLLSRNWKLCLRPNAEELDGDLDTDGGNWTTPPSQRAAQFAEDIAACSAEYSHLDRLTLSA